MAKVEQSKMSAREIVEAALAALVASGRNRPPKIRFLAKDNVVPISGVKR